MELDGKVALITGGASGIGKATAELFAAEGATVAVVDRDEAGAEAVAEALGAASGRAFGVGADVSDADSVDAAVGRTLEEAGRIDILFNNAGILFRGTVLETDPEQWQRVLDVNLTGVFLFSRAVIPHMRAQGGGAIINTSSSTGAHDGNAGTAAYVTSKGGVTLLTRCLAIDHAADNIRVNAIAPGPTDTPMLRTSLSAEALDAFSKTYPMARLGKPAELAQAVLFLASDRASFVTGAVVPVDGGQTAAV